MDSKKYRRGSFSWECIFQKLSKLNAEVWNKVKLNMYICV